MLLRQSDPHDGFPTSEPEIIKDVGDGEGQIKRLVYAESSRFNRVLETKLFPYFVEKINCPKFRRFMFCCFF